MKRAGNREGLTLVELLISTAILVIAISGILLSYLRCLELSEVAKNTSLAVQGAKSRMELIKSTNFSQVKATYHNISFAVNGLNGRGVSYVDDTNLDFLTITVSVSWRQKSGRIYGEDANIDGIIDAGEDGNANNMLDSPVQLVNYIFER